MLNVQSVLEAIWAASDKTTVNNNATAMASTSTRCWRALIQANSANTADVLIGPDDNSNARTIGAGLEYLIEAPNGLSFDLSKWNFKTGTPGQNVTIHILYAY